jgi:negative regulator of flagellin synthesis FlgM
MAMQGTPPSDPNHRVEPLRLPPRPQRASSVDPARPAGGGRDRLEVSAAGRELAEMAAAASATDGERTELILRIRSQIAEGSYEPDAEAVARALLQQLEGSGEG